MIGFVKNQRTIIRIISNKNNNNTVYKVSQITSSVHITEERFGINSSSEILPYLNTYRKYIIKYLNTNLSSKLSVTGPNLKIVSCKNCGKCI